LKHEATDLTAYYRSLEMVLTVRAAGADTIGRVAQLTQKTNQFNLTTRRYSEAEIAALAESDAADVLTVQLADRFGDAGLTGVCILRYEADRAHLDTLLLSCRVLGRGVEDAFLAQCLKRARERGATVVTAEFRPTKKNAMVREFYPDRGFALAGETDASRRFELDLRRPPLDEPAFFARIVCQWPAPRPIVA
jgi:FkbH-like protein